MSERYRQAFWTPYAQYAERNGQHFIVVTVIREADSRHDAEVLPMYVIRFDDGTVIEAWPEEVLTEGQW